MPKSISFVFSTDVLTASKVSVDGIRHIEGRLYCMDLTPCQEEKYFPFICKISLINLEEFLCFPSKGAGSSSGAKLASLFTSKQKWRETQQSFHLKCPHSSQIQWGNFLLSRQISSHQSSHPVHYQNKIPID